VRVAVLADIHGNLPALRAVLAELDGAAPDAILVAGDAVGGADVRGVLDTLAARPEPVRWISGNAEREAVAAWDGQPTGEDEAGRTAAWSAHALDRRWRDELASWPISLALDSVRFCHGSPRRDDELLTRATPVEALREALAGVEETLVVGGHTHQQCVRDLGDGHPTYANAGSVGMPYEGRAAAFWMLVEHGRAVARETPYDVEAAVRELRASGFADLEQQLGDSLLAPVDAAWVSAFFEHAAGRGEHPGAPP
jgi:predicted phosphodiesterase